MSGQGGRRRRFAWGSEPLTDTARGQVWARESATRKDEHQRLGDTQTWLAVQVTELSLALRKDVMTGQDRILALAEFDAHVKTLWLISTGETPEGANFDKFKKYMKDNPV